MRQQLHVADRNGNRAIWWAGYGARASGPGKNTLGVMAHHVYLVLAVVGPGRVLAISGNDSGRVRTRVRTTRGTLAWRRINMTTYALAN
jgi:hypothetical protein